MPWCQHCTVICYIFKNLIKPFSSRNIEKLETFEIQAISQILNVNNKRTQGQSLSILVTLEHLSNILLKMYWWKQCLFIFEILLSKGRSVLSSAQWIIIIRGTESKRFKSLVKNQKNIQMLLIFIEKWLT